MMILSDRRANKQKQKQKNEKPDFPGLRIEVTAIKGSKIK